jgi:hypothetical protein
MIEKMTVSELEQLRAQLAWRAGQGEGVDDDLTAVEDLLARRQRERERQQLAAAEAARRAEAEAAQEREEEAIRQKARLRAVLGGQALAAAEVDRAMDGLCAVLGPFLELGREAYVLSGGQRRVMGQQQAANAISTRLAELLPGHFQRPEHQLRKGLAESLAPVSEENA